MCGMCAAASISLTEQLPANAVHQALLLQPHLLYELLEAAAAAVIQPLLPSVQATDVAGSSQHNCSTSGPAALPGTYGVNRATSSHMISSKCASIGSALDDSKLPVKQLPSILASHPPLMLKVRHTQHGG